MMLKLFTTVVALATSAQGMYYALSTNTRSLGWPWLTHQLVISAAIRITYPGRGLVLDLSLHNDVKWIPAQTDPERFSIELVNMAVNPPVIVEVANDIEVSKGSILIPPVVKITPGESYQYHFISNDPKNHDILAQSPPFTVKKPEVVQPNNPPVATIPSKSAETGKPGTWPKLPADTTTTNTSSESAKITTSTTPALPHATTSKYILSIPTISPSRNTGASIGSFTSISCVLLALAGFVNAV
ncbi:hypothetical protein H109_05196 [Trichophyton interdigitale MR816]|uniref:Yeast cell wall synthesis Kre9/Knh1-like N-terminal domain-containing protein n=1 Tax=Trichophyton interdigitale (strain MR816) TaxID=1215338 RepID=A0A059J533_TRIIM|nr:hypothetical protein H109_05196 [Trichophyton interdigitale MR816]